MASHMSSKGKSQFGATIIGALTTACFKVLKAYLHSFEKTNDTSLIRKLDNGLEIFKKSLINLL